MNQEIEDSSFEREIDSDRRMSIFKGEERNAYGEDFYHDDKTGR